MRPLTKSVWSPTKFGYQETKVVLLQFLVWEFSLKVWILGNGVRTVSTCCIHRKFWFDHYSFLSNLIKKLSNITNHLVHHWIGPMRRCDYILMQQKLLPRWWLHTIFAPLAVFEIDVHDLKGQRVPRWSMLLCNLRYHTWSNFSRSHSSLQTLKCCIAWVKAAVFTFIKTDGYLWSRWYQRDCQW